MVHGHWARQDADLSYLNQPAILTMLMVAGFTSLSKHYLSWSTLPPPQLCVDRMFVTPDGLTIDQQVEKLTEVGVLHAHRVYAQFMPKCVVCSLWSVTLTSVAWPWLVVCGTHYSCTCR